MLCCPHCRASLDPELNLAGRDEPRDWDPRVCPECAEVSVFDFTAPGGLRFATDADWRFWTEDGLAPMIARTTDAAHRARQGPLT
jgi:hypothetical protein